MLYMLISFCSAFYRDISFLGGLVHQARSAFALPLLRILEALWKLWYKHWMYMSHPELENSLHLCYLVVLQRRKAAVGFQPPSCKLGV